MKRISINLPLKLFMHFFFFFLISINCSVGQRTLCAHDEVMKKYIEDHPEYAQKRLENESKIQDGIRSGRSSNRTPQVYTVPVVFHILHLGEPVGGGSNISNAQIMQALADLNGDFSNVNNNGTNVRIQFCLAQQDPDGNSVYDNNGNNITGIQRANASSVPNFTSYGIWSGNNEVAAKALSIWPNSDYVNIWVAHSLVVGNNGAAGFAYFPGASSAVDGIALRSDATGIPANSKVITHEGGHFFNLLHTFQGGNTSTCPLNTNCNIDGDLICETRPHKTFSFPFPCNEVLYTSCQPGFPFTFQVTENHMNYTDNNCRNEFVPEQAARMRSALENLRGSLLTSIGCLPGCTGVTSSFTFTLPTGIIPAGTTITFTNTSVGATNFNWLVNGVLVSSALNLTYTFTTTGIFDVCLDAYGSNGCVSRHCSTIPIGTQGGCNTCLPPPPCERVVNGDFEQVSGNTNSFNQVCGWTIVQSSPFYCNGPSNNALGLWMASQDMERVSSCEPIMFNVGDKCTVQFDYLVSVLAGEIGNNPPQAIQIALVDNKANTLVYNQPLPANATIIAQVDLPAVSYSGQGYDECYNSSYPFTHYSTTFTITDPDNVYLHITGLGSPGIVHVIYIDNVSINCCEDLLCNPKPDFTWDGCNPTNFTGTNTGDGTEYTWNFLCDGFTATGPTVSHTLPSGVPCEVCLTVACDLESGETICKTVTVDCPPDSCLSATVIDVHCNNKGTEDPSDDYWFFDLLVTDLTGNGIYWTTSGDIIESGPYGIIKTIYPSGNIANNPSYTFDVFDAANPKCRITVTVNAPPPCSDSCTLNVTYTIGGCKDPGTPNYASDDQFGVTLNITGTGGQAFMVKKKFSNGTELVVFSGVGDQTVVLPCLSQEGDFTLWIILSGSFDCLVDIYIDAPPTCSGCLSLTTTNVTCFDNGTSDPSDDYWTFDLTVLGGTSYWTASSPINQSGPYGVTKTIWVSSISSGPLTFDVYDAQNPKCTVKLTVTPPKPCSEECKLTIKDFKTYCKNIDGVNAYYVAMTVYVAPGECFMVKRKNADGTEQVLGTYYGSVSLNFGPYSPAEEFTLWISICGSTDCIKDFYVKAPRGCSNCIDYKIYNIQCFDNGTSTPADDYWTFDIVVFGPGNYWTASSPVNQSGAYGVPKTIWVSSFADLDFTIFDNKDTKCYAKVHVTAPDKCSKRCKFEIKYKVTECKQLETGYFFNVTMNIQSSVLTCFTIKKKDLAGNETVLGTFPPNTDFQLGPFAAGENFTLWIMACDQFDCVRDIFIIAPDCRKSEPRIQGRATQQTTTLAPNPVKGTLRVTSNQIMRTLTVYSINGVKMNQYFSNSNEYTIDTEKLDSGLYFVKIEFENNESSVQKFIKIE
jgi:hypothetical protein